LAEYDRSPGLADDSFYFECASFGPLLRISRAIIKTPNYIPDAPVIVTVGGPYEEEE